MWGYFGNFGEFKFFENVSDIPPHNLHFKIGIFKLNKKVHGSYKKGVFLSHSKGKYYGGKPPPGGGGENNDRSLKTGKNEPLFWEKCIFPVYNLISSLLPEIISHFITIFANL